MDATNLVAWLRFDESTTADKCGNSWTAYGTTSIGTTNAISGQALQLNKGYLRSSGQITFGGADFTVDFYGYMNSSSEAWASPFNALGSTVANSRIGQFFIGRIDNGNNFRCTIYNGSGNTQLLAQPLSTSNLLNARHHFELDYSHADSTLRVFVDGQINLTANVTVERLARYIFLGTNGFSPSGQRMVGTLDEFRLFDGVALHTENFTPPTADDYEEFALILGSTVEFTVDVERRISNRVEFTVPVERKVINAWRYVNLGTAATLTVTGTTLENLPATKSVTGTAFYQTAREKCFDLPATDEVWMKFDVYFDGANQWRAYNQNSNGSTGVTGQTDGDFDFWVNSSRAKYFANTAKKNQLQTVILHMVSGSTAGVVEAWVDGDFIYRYTGDVNHGEDFADIYLQSDGAETFFSNVVISNRQLTQADGYQSFTADVERRTTKRIEFTVDVERSFILPLIIPLIMDGHFNHYVAAMPVLNDMTYKIILPKESKAYLHADGINAGAVKIYSDTDDTGAVTGDVYAELGDCKKVYIKSVVSQQSVIKAFMHSLSETNLAGTAAVDEAVNYCSGGLFKTAEEVTNQLTREMTAAEAAGTFDEFLRDRCGVILDNEDTGSATGADAGSDTIKTAESIVPERIPVSEWVTPESNSTTTIKGLTVSFPFMYESMEYYDAKRFILTGLNSCWIEEALTLIEETFGLSFEGAGTTVKEINVDFDNSWADGTIAFVEHYPDDDGNTNYLSMEFCMQICQYIDTTSADGKINYGVTPHIDRVIAHELTHAVMAANIKYYQDLPQFIKEGAAELVHGVDDTRNLSNANDYSGGYLFFRYLMKQTMEHLPPNAQVTLTNLFISEGALDSDGHALTDNTRAIFNADVISELIKHVSFSADVEILDVLYINFVADVMRSIIGKVKLYAGDNSAYFDGSSSGEELTPVVIPSQSLTDIGRSPAAPNNTNGLQSVEITIAEQQITENVHFVGNVPFDIMYPVRGQYLDYLIDMRVERVQKNGILYSCDCCSDIDEIFYTQIAYTVPKSTDWHGSGDTSEEVETATDEFTPATAHAQNLANVLGKTPVIQFAPFNSTVMVDSSGGVTYADLIREIFYWTSRIPTMLINVFIRDDKIYFVQRGYEARLIDLSETKHTIPTVTHDLVRMTWGSTRWSKTETREQRSFNWKPEEYDYSDVYDPDEDDDTTTTPQDGDEETWVAVEDVSTGIDWVAWTTYQYYPKFKGFVEGSLPNVLGGLLAKVTTSKHSTNPDNPDSYTQITHRYNKDKQKVYTETYVHYRGGKDTPKDTRTVNTSRYITLPNGEKFLAGESSTSYEGRFVGDYPSKVVDSTSTTHSPGRQGQTHTIKFDSDGEIVGEVFGQDTGDDRVTPLSLDKAGSLENGKLTSYRYNDETGEWEKIGEWVEETTTEQRTLNGLSLYDSSFPVHGDDKLIEITEAIKWLNRRTKETVTMTIYEYPHLIDFNDRIIFEGNVYFLVSNTATTTERIFNEQRITITRWY